MFNLYEILQNAQGGQAIDNLAKQFNISHEQAEAAVKALMPQMSNAFLQQATQPAAFGSILGALGDNQHVAAFMDASAAQTRETMQKGAEAVQQLFGSPETHAAVAEQTARLAGLPPALIQQMLPVIASMVMGGLSKGLANQGLGGLFGQLAGAAGQGGLGTILGSLLGGAPAAQGAPQGDAAPNPQANPSPAGGLAGVFGQILGGFFGGAQPGGAPPQGGATPSAPHGFDPNTVQAGLDALIKMLQPGTQPVAAPPAAQAGIQNEINEIFEKKRPS